MLAHYWGSDRDDQELLGPTVTTGVCNIAIGPEVLFRLHDDRLFVTYVRAHHESTWNTLSCCNKFTCKDLRTKRMAPQALQEFTVPTLGT